MGTPRDSPFVSGWAPLRVAGGAAILAFVVVGLGTGPFVDGLRHVGWGPAVAALVATAVSTVCCAWRWHLVADRLGADVPWGTAVAAYYRSQFLNATLPGGVVGDLHRAVVHGRRVGDVGRGLRTVAWERSLGQVVQVLLTVVVLLALPSPVRRPVAAWSAVVLVCLAVVLLVARPRLRGGAMCAPAGRFRRALTEDLHRIVVRRAAPRLAVLSGAALGCHIALFMVAAATTGVPLPPRATLVAGLLVLLAAAVPVNVAGWGPREGAAAWVFGMLGATPEQGVSAAVLFGVLAAVGTLPGAAVLVSVRHRRGNGLRSTEPVDVLQARTNADG